MLEELTVENDARLPYAGDRTLLTTISPGGDRGRNRAVVRFRLRRSAHVALDALARNTPSEVALASEAAALTGTRVLSSEGRLLRAGEHAVSWTPPPSVKPGTYTLRLTVTDLHGRRTVYGTWSPVHPKRPAGPVVRVLGLDAAAAARSYLPGETAQIVVRADARSLTLQLFRSGTETTPTYANNLLHGDPVGEPQTIDWATLADAPVPVAVPLPSDLQSGVYYAEIASADGRLGFAPFVVRPAQPTRRVAVVLPTNTWQAYNFQDADGDGYGDSWYVSWRTRTVDLTRAHLNRGVPYRYRSYDLAFLHWLAQSGKQVDFYADEALERFADGDALRASYDLVVFPGHTEYVTTHAYDVVERYRDAGEPDLPVGEQLLPPGRLRRLADHARRSLARPRAPRVVARRRAVPGVRPRHAPEPVRRHRAGSGELRLSRHRPAGRVDVRTVRDRDRCGHGALAARHRRPRRDPRRARAGADGPDDLLPV